MSDDEIKAAIFRAIREIAPEAELEKLDPNAPIRDQVDIDSMDQLNIMIRIHELVGVDIPEADYSKLSTLNQLIRYLGARRL